MSCIWHDSPFLFGFLLLDAYLAVGKLLGDVKHFFDGKHEVDTEHFAPAQKPFSQRPATHAHPYPMIHFGVGGEVSCAPAF